MIGDLPAGVVQDEKGKPKLPQERVASPLQVQEICGAMIDADRTTRAPRRARVDGIINGNRPMNPKTLAGKGFGWMPNCNFLEAEGFLQASQTPLFDLVTETDHCIDLTLDPDVAKASSQGELDDWENKIQQAFTWLLFVRWRKGFNFHLGFQQLQMLKHGLGSHVWPTKSWIPRTPRAGAILFPNNAPINFDEDGEFFMVRDFLPANVLYGFIRNEKAAAALGWKPDAVWKALAHASKDDSSKRSGASDIEQLQRDMRRGDIGRTWNNARQAGVWLNYLYAKEIDTGKISQYVVLEGPGNADVKDYLFKKRNMYDEWELSLFNYDIGDGDLNSIRGLGERTAVFFELSNRLKNAMAAQVLISMFPMVKQMRDDIDPDKLKLLTLGALRILPNGVEPSMINFPPLGNGPIALSDHLGETLSRNNQSSGAPEPQSRETALSYSMRAHDQARVSNGLQSLYESNLQHFYDKVCRKVMDTPKGDMAYHKLAWEMKDRLMRQGVPARCLTSKAIQEIREVTSSGAGSAAARLQGLMTLMNYVFPNTTEDKKVNILRDLTANSMGGAKVDRYAPSLVDTDTPTNDDSMAAVESGELANGGDAVVNGQQNHVKHGDRHLTKAEELIQLCDAGQEDPQHCLQALMKLLDHTGEHLSMLQGNKTRESDFKALSDRWDAAAKYAQQLKGHIEQAANQPDPQAKVSEDLQLGLAKVDADNQVKNKKADADIARKFRKDAFGERLADRKTSASIIRSVATARPAAPASNGAR